MTLSKTLCGLASLFVVAFSQPSQAETITLSEYHDSPPFVQPGNKGLAYDIVALLNKFSPADLSFDLEIIERAALNKQLADNQKKAILLSNPIWFSKVRTDLINSIDLVWDADVFFSYNKAVLNELVKAEGFNGLTLAGHSGYFYKDIKLLIDSNKLTRVDVDSFEKMLTLLKNNQADIAISNRSTINFYNKSHPGEKKLYTAVKANDAYLFSIVLTPDYAALLPKINQTISAMRESNDWATLANKYNIDKLVDLIEFDLVELMDLTL